ncbi:MAG TPA: hypothetical protein ENJ06_00880, partial [Phycisphaeraceae bacterium]|nr:hypothetical protein [Phycisphaeraceae bacterium]
MSANSNKISRKYVASDNATHLGGWRRGLAREEASRRCLLEQLEDRRLLSDPKAELIGTMFEIQESSLTAGERFDVTFEITNVGDVNAHYYSDSIAYFHMWVGDDFWSNGTPLIDWDWSSGPGDIAPGESLGPITVQLNAPTVNEMENRGWGSGNYRIGMYIDGTGAVPEYNEQNNYNYSEGGDYQTIYVNAVDDEPPTAVLHAQDLGPEYYDQFSGHFDITYTDNVQVDIPYYHNV